MLVTIADRKKLLARTHVGQELLSATQWAMAQILSHNGVHQAIDWVISLANCVVGQEIFSTKQHRRLFRAACYWPNEYLGQRKSWLMIHLVHATHTPSSPVYIN